MKKGESYWKWKFNSHLRNWKCFMWLKLKYISHAQAWCSCFVGAFFSQFLMLSFPFWSKQVHKILCGNTPLFQPKPWKLKHRSSVWNEQTKKPAMEHGQMFSMEWCQEKKGTTIHERHFPNEMEHILLVAQRISCAVHEFQYFWEFPTSATVVLGTLD